MKLDVDIPKESTYNMVLRYINPYPDRVIGTIKMETEACSPENPECNQEENVHSVLLNPTGGQPAFVTVSGDKGIYPSPFQLKTETYVTSINIPKDVHPEGEQELLIVSMN